MESFHAPPGAAPPESFRQDYAAFEGFAINHTQPKEPYPFIGAT